MKLFCILALAFLGLAKDDKLIKIQGNWYKIVKIWNEDRSASKTTYVPVDKSKINNNQNLNPNRLPNSLRGRYNPNNAITDLSSRVIDNSNKILKNIRSGQGKEAQQTDLQPAQQKTQDLELTIAATVPISQIDLNNQRPNVQPPISQSLSPLEKFVPGKLGDFFQNSRSVQVLKTLEQDQQNNLTPAESATNVIKGIGNIILNGQNNDIIGKSNLIKQGNQNQIKGDSNTIEKGNRNKIHSQGSYVFGDDNVIH